GGAAPWACSIPIALAPRTRPTITMIASFPPVSVFPGACDEERDHAGLASRGRRHDSATAGTAGGVAVSAETETFMTTPAKRRATARADTTSATPEDGATALTPTLSRKRDRGTADAEAPAEPAASTP